MSAKRRMDDYAGSARYYDLVLAPFLRSLRKHLADWVAQQEIRRCLDIGCGTGKQLSLLPEDTEVFGIDLSPAMLRQAEKRVPGRCVLGDATRLPFEDGFFDLVYTQFALHEKKADVIEGLLGEARRVLAACGRLVVIDYALLSRPVAYDKLRSKVIGAIERFAGREHYKNYKGWMARGGMDGVLREHGWEELASQDFYGGTIKMGEFIPRARLHRVAGAPDR